MRITVDLNRCQGYANCVAAAPDVFDIDDVTGKALLLSAEADEAQSGELREAARSCPVSAITLED